MANDMKGELEAEVELKTSNENFFKFWKNEAHQIQNHSPSHIQAAKLHEGDWGTHGSTKIWHYSIGGRAEVIKERMEVDEEHKVVKVTGLEGDVFKRYKVHNIIWHFKPKGQGSLAKLTIQYEKLNDTVPVPHEYLDFHVDMIKNVDAALAKNP